MSLSVPITLTHEASLSQHSSFKRTQTLHRYKKGKAQRKKIENRYIKFRDSSQPGLLRLSYFTF